MAEVIGRQGRVGKNWWRQGREQQKQRGPGLETPERSKDRSRCRFRFRRRSGESISHNILDARNMHYRAGELDQGGQMALLPGGPRQKTLYKASVKGLWSVKILDSLPSSRKQKCLEKSR